MKINKYIYFTILATGTFLAGCGAGGENQGLEYAPNMYHSVPYEPLSQIVDEDAGEATQFLNNPEDGHGEYFNSNPYNPSRMTMRVPPANTVPRAKNGLLPYRLPKDSLDLAARTLKNPLFEGADSTQVDELIADGMQLYSRFCYHCHGGSGQGDGPVAGTMDNPVFAGIANLTGAAYKNISQGHIFHVITNGKGLMGAHGSQLSPEERWKIAMYVKELQK